MRARSLILCLALAAPSPARADEDDPKLARTQAVVASAPAEAHQAPAFKLSYRRLGMANLAGPSFAFNAGQLDVYPLSRRWIRIGLEAEAGAASTTVEDRATRAWYVAAGVSAGIQYPWRVTPFVEGRFAAGVLGGEIAGQSVVTYMYLGGIDAGIELYLFSRFYLSAALGWVRPAYRGVDVAYARAHPMAAPAYETITTDSFTFKLGVGF